MSNQTTHKKTYVPQIMSLNETQRIDLYRLLKNDLYKGIFNSFSHTKETIISIINKLYKNKVLSDIEIVTLKANDYIRDNRFKLPLWYYSTNL